MPHPIYGRPSHQLAVVTCSLVLPCKRNNYRSSILVEGVSETKRAALWSVRESWEPGEVTAGLQPADAIHHVLLVASQDRPASQDVLERHLTGGGWEKVSLPF